MNIDLLLYQRSVAAWAKLLCTLWLAAHNCLSHT